MRVGLRLSSTMEAFVFRKSLRLTNESQKNFPSLKLTNMITTNVSALELGMKLLTECMLQNLAQYVYSSICISRLTHWTQQWMLAVQLKRSLKQTILRDWWLARSVNGIL